MDHLSEQTIKGYELRERIGAGGFGAVYRAYQPVVGREVAIKVILPQYANHPDFIRRFEAEAQLVARLEHPHIVPLYDYWREPDGAYLVMRFLHGGSLGDKIRTGGALPLEEADRLLDQITAALAVAHRHGVVHRDLKPANILLDEDGNAYLTDFGIAKSLKADADEDESEASLTGSPHYMSPEQAQQNPVSLQSDIYSLGIVLFEMLTGNTPFADTETLMEILLKQINEPLPSIQTIQSDMPEAVNLVIQRATAKNPEARYSDARSFAIAFRQAIEPAQIKTGEFAAVRPPVELTTLVVPGINNPYKGLRAFEEADSDDFFGRDHLVQHLLTQLKEKNFLAVIGPSGSGKSSVVKAGVLPALRRGALPGSDRWFLAQMVPGHDPFQELETALLSVASEQPSRLGQRLRQDETGLSNVVEEILPGSQSVLLLVIDQFEEIFTYSDDPAIRSAFLNSLLVAVTQPGCRLRVMITLRADFYDRPLLYPGFGELIRRHSEVVLPLSAEEMEQAVVGPAERAGLKVEPALVSAITAEISEQPGALPLLQYALTEIFERREGDTLTLQAYQASGGVLGALARRAEELYTQLDDQEQEAARQMFLRLVTLGGGVEDTRRRVAQAELIAVSDNQEAAQAVLDTYSKYRLFTFDNDPVTRAPTAELAHEALIREWQRLREWLNDSRDDVRIQQRLSAAAREWINQHHDPSFLAEGMRLQQFEVLIAGTNIVLTEDETGYVQASVAKREALLREEETRRAREAALEKRAKKRLQALAISLTVFLAIALLLSLFAFDQQQQAKTEADHADRNASTAIAAVATSDRRAAEVGSVARAEQAQSVSAGDPFLAYALVLDAVNINNPPPEAQVVLASLVYNLGAVRAFTGHTSWVNSVAFSPDGKTALSGSADDTLMLWDVASGKSLRTFTGHSSWVTSVAFSPDGQTAVSGSYDGTLILWDVASGKNLRTFTGHTGRVSSVAFSPDGKTILSGAEDNTLMLWDAASAERIRTFTGHTNSVWSVAFSPDGKTALSGSEDNTLILWDVESGGVLRTLAGNANRVSSVAFSPDGKTILSGQGDGTVSLWDAASGTLLYTLRGHTGGVTGVAFSPDGRMAVSGSMDQTLIVWDLSSGTRARSFTGHTNIVTSVAFSPDGQTVLSGAADNTLILWAVQSGSILNTFRGHTEGVSSVAFSPDGQTVLSGAADDTMILWDAASGNILHTFAGPDSWVDAVAFSPDGKTALAGMDDSTLILWNITGGDRLRTFSGHTSWVNSVAFSPDGKLILSGSADGTLIVWDAASATSVRVLTGHTDSVSSVAFSPDGTTALSGSADSTLILWDITSGDRLRTFTGHTAGVTSVAFSPDGQTALSGSDDGTLILWGVRTGDRLYTFTGHTDSVTSVAFSPNGKLALSGSADNTLILWDISDRNRLWTLSGHTAAVSSVAFSPDGTTALSGSYDDTLMLWRIDSLDSLIRWAYTHREVRELTCEERHDFRVEPGCNDQGIFPTRTPYPG